MVKDKWGGSRKGAGRKPKIPPLRVLKIQATEAELTEILTSIPDTRQRTKILLMIARGQIQIQAPTQGQE